MKNKEVQKSPKKSLMKSNEEVITSVRKWISLQLKDFFSRNTSCRNDGVGILKTSWEKWFDYIKMVECILVKPSRILI